MDIYSAPRPVSNLSQILRFPDPEGKEGLERQIKTRFESVKTNISVCGLAGLDP